MYEATMKSGRSLHEKAQFDQDRQHLENQLAELKDTWDTISGKSMERYAIYDTIKTSLKFFKMTDTYLFVYFIPFRQHKLEEALLFSGRFTDALQALNDWLYRAEPQLAEDVPVGGDKDTVNNLIDKHKVWSLNRCMVSGLMQKSTDQRELTVQEKVINIILIEITCSKFFLTYGFPVIFNAFRLFRRSWGNGLDALGLWSALSEIWQGAAQQMLTGCRSRWMNWMAAGRLFANYQSANRTGWRLHFNRYCVTQTLVKHISNQMVKWKVDQKYLTLFFLSFPSVSWGWEVWWPRSHFHGTSH